MGLSPDTDFDAIPVGYLESLEVDGRFLSKTPVSIIVGYGKLLYGKLLPTSLGPLLITYQLPHSEHNQQPRLLNLPAPSNL